MTTGQQATLNMPDNPCHGLKVKLVHRQRQSGNWMVEVVEPRTQPNGAVGYIIGDRLAVKQAEITLSEVTVSLKELRKQWEKGWQVVLVLPVILGEFKKVFVILGRETPAGSLFNYRLHRYTCVGDRWDVSVDVQEAKLEDCVEHIHHNKDVADLYLQLGREHL